MENKTKYSILSAILLALVSGVSCPRTAYASKQLLESFYQQLKPALDKNVYGIPVYINSSDIDNTMTGSIYGVLSQPFSRLSAAIKPAANWCDITPLHLNIKACTYQPVNQKCQLNFYSGRKFYEKADDVYKLSYQFDIIEHSKDFIHLRLTAEEGPAGTSQYQLTIKAIPLDKQQSFISFSYSYHYNFITSMGMSTYLATLGSDKIGFSVNELDIKGKPVYIQGVRGIIERNSIRYYFAIQAYLDSLGSMPDKRYSESLPLWFELTEKYRPQLHELEKNEYLTYKKQERADQLRLQNALKIPAELDQFCR